MSSTELGALLARARERNASLGLSGMLLYADGSFFQVLEGQADVVLGLYERIERDPRHNQVTCIIHEPIPRRCFGAWSMGFSNLSAADALAQPLPGDRPMCADAGFPAFTYAYQPIVDVLTREVFSYEALIRGADNAPAFRVHGQIPEAAKYEFDQVSRIAAIELAQKLGLRAHLNLNVLPGSLFAPEVSIEATLEAATRCGLPLDRVILEVTESEAIADHTKFAGLLHAYRARGIKVAIDDFGAGICGLNLLADFQPDQIKSTCCWCAASSATARARPSRGPSCRCAKTWASK